MSAKFNVSIAMIVSMVLAFALMGPLTLGLIGATERGWITDSNAAGTYTHDGRVWEYYEDKLPLTMEDLTGKQEQGYSRQLTTDSTIFLTRTEGQQRPRFDAENYKALSHLEYTIIQVKMPFLFDVVKNAVINEYQDEVREDYVLIDHYEPVDPAPWGADEAYQHHWSESVLDTYLLVWGDRIVEINFYSQTPTPEQMAIVSEKLGNISQ